MRASSHWQKKAVGGAWGPGAGDGVQVCSVGNEEISGPLGVCHCGSPGSSPWLPDASLRTSSLLGVTSISHCEKVANFSGNRKNRLSKEARTPAPSSTVQRGETEVWLGLRTRPPGAPQRVVPTLGCPTPGQVGEWAERLPAFLPAFLPVYIAQGWGCGNLGRSDLCPA